MSHSSEIHDIGLVAIHDLCEVLSLTRVTSRLRAQDPSARLCWIVRASDAWAVEQHPDADEVVALPPEASTASIRRGRDWYRLIEAPYLPEAPYGRWESAVLAAGFEARPQEPPRLRFREEDVERAQAWWSGLRAGRKILLDLPEISESSPWSPDMVSMLVDGLQRLDPIFVLSGSGATRERDQFSALRAHAVVCPLEARAWGALYNLADAFIGVGGLGAAISSCLPCRDDVPGVEWVAREVESTSRLGRHRRRRYAFSEHRFSEAIRSLAAELQGGQAPVFWDSVRVIGLTEEAQERIACPSCNRDLPEAFRGLDVVRCRSCGLIYLRERPERSQLLRYYSEVYAVNEPSAAPAVRVPPSREAVDTDPALLGAQRAAMLQEALDHLGRRADNLIDVGCGWGAMLHGARNQGIAGIGFELTRPNVAFAQDVLGLDVRREGFPMACLEEASADVVTFSHSLEHVPDPMSYLRKANHVLRDGGILSVVVPNIRSLCSEAMGEHWPWLEREWHYTHFDPTTLSEMVVQAGFDVISCTTRSGDFGDIAPLEVLETRMPGSALSQRMTELGLLEREGRGEEVHLLARRVGGSRALVEPSNPPGRILWVRTDSIGDAILSNAMLEPLRAAHPEAEILVVCPAPCAPLYEVCPHIQGVVTFDRDRLVQDKAYLGALMARLGAYRADLCLCPVHSRDSVSDMLVLGSGAPVRVGFSGDLANMTADEHEQLDPIYSRLLPPLQAHALELDRAAAFLDALGVPHGPLQPVVWLTEADRAAAEALRSTHDLEPSRMVALFPGAQYAPRRYPSYGQALAPVVESEGLTLVALGTESERELCGAILEELPGRHLNLAGQLGLRESLALLARCRVAVGAESGLAQACCALGVPHAVVIGGGHFGRFLPYSPLTQLAALPLACYLCNWSCPYPRAHCVQDLAPGVLEAAFRAALGPLDAVPRLFVSRQAPGLEDPQAVDVEPGLDPAMVTLVRVDAAVPVASVPRIPRTTVICAVWHQDPERWDRLQAHQACLDAQTVPVERLYVFDGGDTAPEWLKGQWVSTQRGLALYEAWDLAFHMARTPYVMNLNLDDRLSTDAVERLEGALDAGADLVGGEWRICFSQEDTDVLQPAERAEGLPFHPEWPPVRPTRLGSGTGERGTYGPATMWRRDLRRIFPTYPWRLKDGSPLKIIGDALWWQLLQQAGKRLVRLPVVVGRYHSHPKDQAEFRHPSDQEHARLGTVGLDYP